MTRLDPVAGLTIFGRDAERLKVARFIDRRGTGGVLVLSGEPGIGKTTLWAAGLEAARQGEMLTLSARPSDAEAHLSFAGLIDLLEGVRVAGLGDVPEPQQRALEIALLQSEPHGGSPEPRAIALGLLNALKALADDRPVLVAVDDVQWLDGPSTDALAFAARRLEHDPVAFLLAKRPGPAASLERAFEQRRTETLEVGGMSHGALRRLLSERLGLTLSRPLLRRLAEATLGNPFFALEIGRRLAEDGLPSIGEDLPMPASIEDALSARVRGLPRDARRALLALALGGSIEPEILIHVAGPSGVEQAADSGLLAIEGHQVRVAHPLLASAATKHSLPSQRREIHLTLADATENPELRAQHLALATTRPDGVLAATVAFAADRAAARGAREEAVQLAQHALRLTPEDAPMRSDRVLGLGEYLRLAGDLQRLTDLMVPQIDLLSAGAARAQGWLLASDGAHVQSIEQYDAHLDHAIAESGDHLSIRLQAMARKAAYCAARVARIGETERWARETLPAATRQGPAVQRPMLYALGWASALAGHPISAVCEQFRTASDAAYHLTESPERVAWQQLVWRGEVAAARDALTRALALADERGELVSYAVQRLHLCELELRAGEWDPAEALLKEWAESTEQHLMFAPMYERCRSLLTAGRGDPSEARRWASAAIARSHSTGVWWDWCEASRARGQAELLDQDPQAASETLRAVWERTKREGVDEPGAFPVGPELVEALSEIGELEEALSVSDRLRRLAVVQQHPWGLASAKRARATALLSVEHDETHARTLADAAADYEHLGLRFDRARTLLSLGRALRRHKQWAAARNALTSASTAFDQLGSPGWATRARAEARRVAGRPAQPKGTLTASEQQVAELAAKGLSNKQIAGSLYLTVHTVEVHLSRVYRKLGIDSRRQLPERLPPPAETTDSAQRLA
jgi:DNA-binding NarL/FixJ family response regulator